MNISFTLVILLLIANAYQARGQAVEEVDFVLVGAGISALSAARDLVDAGYSVVILEAQDRYAGRIKTVRVPGL